MTHRELRVEVESCEFESIILLGNCPETLCGLWLLNTYLQDRRHYYHTFMLEKILRFLYCCFFNYFLICFSKMYLTLFWWWISTLTHNLRPIKSLNTYVFRSLTQIRGMLPARPAPVEFVYRIISEVDFNNN